MSNQQILQDISKTFLVNLRTMGTNVSLLLHRSSNDINFYIINVRIHDTIILYDLNRDQTIHISIKIHNIV